MFRADADLAAGQVVPLGGNDCPQPAGFLGDAGSDNEDCLYLNVITPWQPAAAKRPVLVYLHGRGFYSGSAQRDADGRVRRQRQHLRPAVPRRERAEPLAKGTWATTTTIARHPESADQIHEPFSNLGPVAPQLLAQTQAGATGSGRCLGQRGPLRIRWGCSCRCLFPTNCRRRDYRRPTAHRLGFPARRSCTSPIRRPRRPGCSTLGTSGAQ